MEENKNIPFYNLEKSEDTLWYRFMQNVYLEENIKKICKYRNQDDLEIIIGGKYVAFIHKISVDEEGKFLLSHCFHAEKNFKCLMKIIPIRANNDILFFKNNDNDIRPCLASELIPFNSIKIYDSYSKTDVNLKEEYEKACKNYEEWQKKRDENLLKIDYITNIVSALQDKQYFLFKEITNINEKLDLILKKLEKN